LKTKSFNEYTQLESINQRGSESKLLVFLSFLALLFAAIPFFYLIKGSFSGEIDLVRTVLLREKSLEIFATTIALMSCVAVASTFLGVSLAWCLHNVSLRSNSLIAALVILPIAIPSYVYTYSWMSIIPNLRGFLAAVFILILTTTPYITLAALAALRRNDQAQLEVAQTLGLSKLRCFYLITWPQIRNTVSAGTLLVALYVLSDFGAVSLLGVDTFTRAIENLYRGSFDRGAAAILALVLVCISAILITIESNTRQRSRVISSSNRVMPVIAESKSSRTRLLASVLIGVYLLLALIIPLMQLLLRFISALPEIDYSNLVKAAVSTIFASLLGSIIALMLALPVGLLSSQASKIGSLTDKSLLIVHALPGIVMGLSLVAFGSELPIVYQTVALLAFSYALLFMAKAVGFVRTSFLRVPKNLMEISSTLNQSKTQSIRRIMIPLATPGLLTATLLVFLSAMKELPATLMLRPTGFETLATEMWSATAILEFNEAAPYALLLVLIAAIPAFLVNRPDKSEESGVNIS
jgi:iron(III) transport system permease protein